MGMGTLLFLSSFSILSVSPRSVNPFAGKFLKIYEKKEEF
jgi:hypothetical protein